MEIFNPQKLLTKDYTRYYRREKDDSPKESRTSLIRRIRSFANEGKIHPSVVLNIGSGPQSLEKQLMGNSDDKARVVLNSLQFVSVDIADILKVKLLAKKIKNTNHFRADVSSLPFKDESFGLVFSNLAIDFCPRDTSFDEAFRVLAFGGYGIFYLHHPSLIKDSTTKDESTVAFWNYLSNNNLLFSTEDEIRYFLEKKGFHVDEVSLKKDKSKREIWWEVVVKKN